MKTKKFSEAMNEIKDKYYEEAVSFQAKRNRRGWVKWGTMAACIVLVVYIGIQELSQESQKTTIPLPLLTISENISAGMGFEGYMAYDISELVNGNPWHETTQLSTLPVYQNQLTYDENYQALGANEKEMKTFLLDVATRLGLNKKTLHITDNTPNKAEKAAITKKFEAVGERVPKGYFSPTKVIGEEEGIEISVSPSMTATIDFDPALGLPDNLSFTHHSSYEDIQKVADYLKENYKELIAMEKPEVNIYGGDYDIYDRQAYHLEFFEASGDVFEEIINYNFNRVAFYCDDEGKLFLARVYNPNLSEKMGDYPIITKDEATELLLNGNYMTSVPYEVPGRDYIAKAELVYRTGEQEKYYMPYYRFYVELQEEVRDGGIKTYGAYYVPAIERSYISNMPIGDGSFN